MRVEEDTPRNARDVAGLWGFGYCVLLVALGFQGSAFFTVTFVLGLAALVASSGVTVCAATHRAVAHRVERRRLLRSQRADRRAGTLSLPEGALEGGLGALSPHRGARR